MSKFIKGAFNFTFTKRAILNSKIQGRYGEYGYGAFFVIVKKWFEPCTNN